MPRIPGYNQQEVGVRPLAPARVPVGARTNALVEFGNTALAIGLDNATRWSKEQELADETRVSESLNMLRGKQLDLALNPQTGYSAQLGKNAIARESGKPLTDEYMGLFDEAAQEISRGLSTERQRQKFHERAGAYANEFRGGVMRHEFAQGKAYANDVDKATIELEVENAGRYWGNKDRLVESFNRMDGAILNKARRAGVADDDPQLAVDRREIHSKAHLAVLAQALGAKNFPYAEKYLKDNGDDMNNNDKLEVQNLYRKEDVANFAVVKGTEIVREAVEKSDPSPMNSLEHSLVQAESNGRQFDAKGNTVTSPKGALGKWQVMPGTGPEAAKLAGVPWDLERLKKDEAYNELLGRAYFREQMKTFNGDIAKATAAYNMGPGDEKLGKGVKGLVAQYGANWLDHAPEETRNYVAKVAGGFGSGVNPPRPSLLELERKAEKLAGNDIEKRRALISEVQRQYTAWQGERKQRDDETVDTALKLLEKNGGDYNKLPLETRRNIPGDKLEYIHRFAKATSKRAAGFDNETDLAAYFKLSDEDTLRGMPKDVFYAHKDSLSESDFKTLSNAYHRANGQATQSKIEDLNSTYIKQVLDNRLRGLGIDPTPDDKSSEGQMRVGAIRRTIDQEILLEQKARGAKLTDAEIQSKIDALFAVDQKFKQTYLLGSPTIGSRKLYATKMSDIPANVKKDIEDRFKARNITPSDQDILSFYLQARAAESRKKEY